MSAIHDVIKEEYRRLDEVMELYDKKIAECPKGSLSKKRRGNRVYFYRAYRDDKKVRFEYLGKEGDERVSEFKARLAERRRYEKMKRRSQENLDEVKVLLRVAER